MSHTSRRLERAARSRKPAERVRAKAILKRDAEKDPIVATDVGGARPGVPADLRTWGNTSKGGRS